MNICLSFIPNVLFKKIFGIVLLVFSGLVLLLAFVFFVLALLDIPIYQTKLFLVIAGIVAATLSLLELYSGIYFILEHRRLNKDRSNFIDMNKAMCYSEL